jgi:hypothetical protein
MEPGANDDIQAIRNELEGLRTEVHAARAATRPWWARAYRPRLAKRLTRVGVVALMLAMPVLVSAAFPFTDVPTSNTYYTSISRLYGARITTGCSATKFCPNANVTRGQMAAFLNRGLGRAGNDWGATGFADDWAAFNDNSLGALNLVHGGATGGTGLVLVTASVSAYTREAGVCPCELAVWLVNVNTGEESPAVFQTITNVASPPDDNLDAWYETSTSMNYLFTVSSGATNTYVLGSSINTTTPPTDVNGSGAEWSMSAVYIPFGPNGSNPSLTSTQSVDGRRGH